MSLRYFIQLSMALAKSRSQCRLNTKKISQLMCQNYSRTLSTSPSILPSAEHVNENSSSFISLPVSVRNPTTGQMEQIDWNFHKLWLRLNCRCPSCREASSGQRMINPWNIRGDSSRGDIGLQVVACSIEDESPYVSIDWAHADGSTHKSQIDKQTLTDYYTNIIHNKTISASRRPPALTGFTRPPTFSHEKFVQNTDQGVVNMTRFNAMDSLLKYGAMILDGAPGNMDVCKQTMQHLGPILDTIYGMDFIVKINENPVNIAYSSHFLDFHTDLLYYESAPGIQALHCIDFDPNTKGGDSLLVDGFAVAEQMRSEHPDMFDVLTKVYVRFQKVHFKRENPVYMTYDKPHFALNKEGELIGVNWAPAFEGSLRVTDESVLDEYYRAYTQYGKMLQDSPYKLQFRLEPGEILIFNNRRTFHGRTEIQSGGNVVVRKAYVTVHISFELNV